MIPSIIRFSNLITVAVVILRGVHVISSSHPNHDAIQPFQTRIPSRPPAPLLSSVDDSSIIISMKGSPNDFHNNVNVVIEYYQVQVEQKRSDIEMQGWILPTNNVNVNGNENGNGNKSTTTTTNDTTMTTTGVWKDLESVVIPISRGTTANQVATATLSNVTHNEGHRFRMRAVNSMGASPWSYPSQVFSTLSSKLPPAPINLRLVQRFVNSLQIMWDVPISSQNIKHYQVQYRKHFRPSHHHHQDDKNTINLNNNFFEWQTLPDKISSLQSVAIPEVQLITTLVDPTSSITNGHFWLQMTLPTAYPPSPFQPPSPSSSPLSSAAISLPIPYNATALEMQQAIQHIQGMGKVYVTRYGPANHNHHYNSSSDLPVRGSYTWKIELDLESSSLTQQQSHVATTNLHLFPLFEQYKSTLNGVYHSDSSGSRSSSSKTILNRIQIKRLQSGSRAQYKSSSLSTTILKLNENTLYDVRVRAIKDFGQGGGGGPWSTILKGIFTDVPKVINYTSPLKSSKLNTKLELGKGRWAAHRNDGDYHGGCGMGGYDGENGNDGLIVIVFGVDKHPVDVHSSNNYNSNNRSHGSSRTIYYFHEEKQHYVVPGVDGGGVSSTHQNMLNTYVTIKAWGAGGAGGMGPDNNVQNHTNRFSHGGGGGYAEARIRVTPGEILDVVVGGGGKSYSSSFDSNQSGGIHGGGMGGIGIRGNGGGGGGMSAVYRSSSSLLLAAGGGGGGGATDYCCAHGGAGGNNDDDDDDDSGEMGGGENGISPQTPRDLSKDFNDLNETIKWRREFTPQDCHTLECVDERDKIGLPAHHLHIERGFAPNASYSILATGGLGGSYHRNGASGISGNYQVHGLNINALPGAYGKGGKGGNGRDGGGGGGAGIMGGGGGGSGVDGAGGGGGSGYIDYTAVYIPYPREKPHSDFSFPVPIVKDISHSSFVLELDHSPYVAKGLHVKAYDIELSHGRFGGARENDNGLDKIMGCSDEFSLYNHIPTNHMNMSPLVSSPIQGLEPNTHYCVQILVLFLNGNNQRSESIRVTTLAYPQNEWKRIQDRIDFETMDKTQDIMYSFDGHPCESQLIPAARRGHSLSYIHGTGYVYMFGGVLSACSCDTMKIAPEESSLHKQNNNIKSKDCISQVTYSNELWRLDISTAEWTLLQPSGLQNNDLSLPKGREQHSTTVMPDGNLVIMGGLGENTTIYGDVWKLDPGRRFVRVVEGSKLEKLPMSLRDASIIRHTTSSNIVIHEHNKTNQNVCVVDLDMQISIYHECIEQLEYIRLYGPETFTNTSRVNLQRGSGHYVQVWINSLDSTTKCSSSYFNMTFSDSATRSILDWDPGDKQYGRFRPAESLHSMFEGVSVNGEWTLELYDSQNDKQAGSLLDWKIKMNVIACHPEVTWEKLSTPYCETGYLSEDGMIYDDCNAMNSDRSSELKHKNIFTPRYGHTTILVENSVFVMGGQAEKQIYELLKYDYSSNGWRKLSGRSPQKQWVGRSAILTPWGLFLIGGLHIQNHNLRENNIFNYNVVNETLAVVKITYPSDQVFESVKSRFLSSTCLVGLPSITNFETIENSIIFEGPSEPMIIQFAGDEGKRHFGDLWVLILREFSKLTQNHAISKHEAICSWRLASNSTTQLNWSSSCDPKADQPISTACRWQDILLMSWCHKQYQSFTSPF